jgi:hypothetical protein
MVVPGGISLAIQARGLEIPKVTWRMADAAVFHAPPPNVFSAAFRIGGEA